jgi:hypothetical protein
MRRRLSSKVFTHSPPSLDSLLTPTQQENVTEPRHTPQKPILTYKDRTKRVKDARNEAQKEIEDYKTEKENEYQKFDKEVRLDHSQALMGGAES